MQISTDWHNLLVSLNQFVLQATQCSYLLLQISGHIAGTVDKREDKLENSEETVLIFKGMSSDLLNWLEQ